MNEKRKMNGVEFQLERIGKNPIQMKDNIIVLDRLEQGVLQVYKPFVDYPVYIQPIDGTDRVDWYVKDIGNTQCRVKTYRSIPLNNRIKISRCNAGFSC